MSNIVKNTTFPSILDLLAPHSCRGCGLTGSVLCNRCKKNIINSHVDICPQCKTAKTTPKCQYCSDLPPTHIIGERTGLLDTLIHDFKYDSTRAIYLPLAELLDIILPNYQEPIVIVPLPTITKHIRARGLDHTYLVAKHFAKLRGKNYQVQKLLLRSKNTVQVGTDRQTRAKQASSAYCINSKFSLKQNSIYLLLDDVWTTGASIRAAEKRLREFGAHRIEFVILALSRINQ